MLLLLQLRGGMWVHADVVLSLRAAASIQKLLPLLLIFMAVRGLIIIEAVVQV